MDKLFISFSGGRTSAVMTKLLIDKFPDTEKIITFANTGCEHPATLEFVNDCDKHWGFNTVWIEAVVDPREGHGVRHKVVTYETASRNGMPFEDAIAKYGIPNPATPQCTARLKTEPMESYRKSIGWEKGTFKTAIGIRADEIDRVSPKAEEKGLWYPLFEWGWIKEMVDAYMRKSPFDLAIPNDAYGNCVFCWKKSIRKLATVAQANPSFFDFPALMEEKYRFHKPGKAANDQGERLFFREYRRTQDILDIAKEGNFEPYTDSGQTTIWDELLDMGGACGEGCEIEE